MQKLARDTRDEEKPERAAKDPDKLKPARARTISRRFQVDIGFNEPLFGSHEFCRRRLQHSCICGTGTLSSGCGYSDYCGDVRGALKKSSKWFILLKLFQEWKEKTAVFTQGGQYVNTDKSIHNEMHGRYDIYVILRSGENWRWGAGRGSAMSRLHHRSRFSYLYASSSVYFHRVVINWCYAVRRQINL